MQMQCNDDVGDARRALSCRSYHAVCGLPSTLALSGYCFYQPHPRAVCRAAYHYNRVL
jgi:hypothetical protein